VQYSDDNSSWTTAFSGVASNNTACGIQTNTGTGSGAYGSRRYWRYVEGSAVVSHHPRVSRIILTDVSGQDFDFKVYTTDNCSDIGDYIIGTVSLDTGTISTTWSDLTTNNISGSLINGTTFDSRNGGSLLFDGSNDYVTLSNSRLAPGTGAFTWNFWAKLNNLSNFSILFSGAGSNSSYGVIAMNPGSFGLSYYAGAYRITDNNTNFGTNWWYISFVGNGAANGSRNLKLYRNAVQAGSTYTNDYNFTATTPIIGANHSSFSELMRGYVSNVTYYNRELSTQEIQQNFNAMRWRFGI
jgi:hypothetical protein